MMRLLPTGIELLMQLIDYDLGLDRILSPSECQEIVDFFLSKLDKGDIKQHLAQTRKETTTDSKYDKGHRAGYTASAYDFPYEQDIIDAVYAYAQQTKISFYQDRNPSGFRAMDWQFTMYKDNGDHFKEHQDQSVSHKLNLYHNNMDSSDYIKYRYRKISCSIQLSDPEDYKDCSLQIRNSNASMMAPPNEQGSIVCFPSYAHHIVTPLTSGTRYAMVGWFFGPHWR
jgi:predicted 2-oxoglutarate/Fe(II)-dependent dioxygenase YbiX